MSSHSKPFSKLKIFTKTIPFFENCLKMLCFFSFWYVDLSFNTFDDKIQLIKSLS